MASSLVVPGNQASCIEGAPSLEPLPPKSCLKKATKSIGGLSLHKLRRSPGEALSKALHEALGLQKGYSPQSLWQSTGPPAFKPCMRGGRRPSLGLPCSAPCAFATAMFGEYVGGLPLSLPFCGPCIYNPSEYAVCGSWPPPFQEPVLAAPYLYNPSDAQAGLHHLHQAQAKARCDPGACGSQSHFGTASLPWLSPSKY